MAELFNLTWTDFPLSLSSAFSVLNNEEDLRDVTLVCDDGEVDAHKLVLYSGSLFFKSVLRKSKHSHPLLYMKGVKINHVKTVIDFLYKGEVNVAQDDLADFMNTAMDLKIKGLSEQEVAIPGSQMSWSQLRNGSGYAMAKPVIQEESTIEKDITNIDIKSNPNEEITKHSDMMQNTSTHEQGTPMQNMNTPKQRNVMQNDDTPQHENLIQTQKTQQHEIPMQTSNTLNHKNPMQNTNPTEHETTFQNSESTMKSTNTPKHENPMQFSDDDPSDSQELSTEKRSERYERLCKKRKVLVESGPVDTSTNLDMESIMRGFYKDIEKTTESEVLNLMEKVRDATETHGWAWSCKVCNKRNYDKHKIRKHVRTNHVNKDKENKSGDTSFAKETESKNVDKSSPEEPEVFNLMQKSHDSDGKLIWSCKKCGKTSPERRRIRKHVKAEHLDGQDKTLENNASEDSIRNTIHDVVERKYEFTSPDDAVTISVNLDIDESSLSTEVSFVDIDKVGETETTDEGTDIEIGDSYAKNLSKIIGLIEKVTDPDGNQSWSCKECKQTSEDKTNIRNHVETHISGLYYECPLCVGKKLSSKKSLDVHLDKFHYNE